MFDQKEVGRAFLLTADGEYVSPEGAMLVLPLFRDRHGSAVEPGLEMIAGHRRSTVSGHNCIDSDCDHTSHHQAYFDPKPIIMVFIVRRRISRSSQGEKCLM